MYLHISWKQNTKVYIPIILKYLNKAAAARESFLFNLILYVLSISEHNGIQVRVGVRES